jgi:hypothetical protein
LVLKANTTDAYPKIELLGDAYINLNSKDDIYFEYQNNQMFKLHGDANYTYAYGKNATGKILQLYANATDAYPYIELTGNTNIKNYLKAGSAFYLYDSAVQAHKFTYAANVSTYEGGHTTGDILKLKANDVDAYPFIDMTGNSRIRLYTKNDVYFISNGTLSHVFLHSAGVSTMEGGANTGDDLILKANDTDTYPSIRMEGSGGIIGALKTNSAFVLEDEAVRFFQIYHAGTDAIIYSQVANDNIYLNPTGTGKVKFGTYAATGDTASNGYITILDAAGNTRKLMTCA